MKILSDLAKRFRTAVQHCGTKAGPFQSSDTSIYQSGLQQLEPRILLSADLVASIDALSDPWQWGDSVRFDIEVENIGDTTAGISSAELSMSEDTNIGDSDDEFLAYITVPGLSAGQKWTSNGYQITLPSSPPSGYPDDGNVYFGITADAFEQVGESSGNNNTDYDRVAMSLASGGGIDLVSAYFNADEPLQAGDSFDVEFEVANEGSADAGSFFTNFYLSTNSSISSGDHVLGAHFHFGVDGNQDTGRITKTFTLPSQGHSFWEGDGNYYVGMIIDPNEDVSETDEGNNEDDDRVAISGTAVVSPDISGFSDNPVVTTYEQQPFHIYGSDFENGAKVFLTDNTNNDGPYEFSPTSNASRYTWHDSGHIEIQPDFADTNDVLPANWTVTVENPTSGQSDSRSLTVEAPVAATPVISSLSPSTMPASSSNQTLTINGSNFDSDATLTFDPPTGANISSTANKLTWVNSSRITYQINNDNDAGSWRVRVNNPSGQVSDWASFSVEAATASPDLTASNISVNDSSVSAGDTITINYTLQNLGGPAGASKTEIRLVNPNDPTDILTEIEYDESGISGNSSEARSHNITVPIDAAPDTYRVRIFIDNQSSVGQDPADENNDIVWGPFVTVANSPVGSPDLVVQGGVAASPNPVSAGSSVTVSYTLANTGSAASNSSTTKVQIKRASDNALLKQQNFAVGSLAGGGTRSENHSLTLPSSAIDGQYRVYVILDNYSDAGQTQAAEANDDDAFTTIAVQQTTAPTYNIGDRVSATDGLNVRTAPASTNIIVTQNPGEKGDVISGPQTAEYFGVTYTWYQIAWDDGNTGWSVETYLAPAQTSTNPDDPTGLVDVFIASPNYESRPSGQTIDAIVIHTTEASYSSTINTFQNPASQVSAHYVIEQDGTITQMVHPDDRSFHATYYNDRSIGIEMVGYAGDPGTWTKANLDSLGDLIAALVEEYPSIPIEHPTDIAIDYGSGKLDVAGIVGHSQVQPFQGEHNLKSDPGQYFDWSGVIANIQIQAGVMAPDTDAPSIESQPVQDGLAALPTSFTSSSFSASVISGITFSITEVGGGFLNDVTLFFKKSGSSVWKAIKSVSIPNSNITYEGTFDFDGTEKSGDYKIGATDTSGNAGRGDAISIEDDVSGANLLTHFPFADGHPYTWLINAYFDHDVSYSSNPSRVVRAFTGEEGRPEFGERLVTGILYEFKQANGQLFDLNPQYHDSYLAYDEHRGTDFKTTHQSSWKIPVLAAASGTVRLQDSFNTVVIEHGEDFETWYQHLDSRSVVHGQEVLGGQQIGISGDYGVSGPGGVPPHLHFVVRKKLDDDTWVSIDPYGWAGEPGNDPFVGPDSNPIESVNLWHESFGDQRSYLRGLQEDHTGGLSQYEQRLESPDAKIRLASTVGSNEYALFLVKGSDAAVARTVHTNIVNPTLTFDYHFVQSGVPGDRLVVNIDGVEVWSMTGSDYTGTTFESTGGIDLSAWAGQTVELEIRLATTGPDSGEDQAQVWIDNVIVESKPYVDVTPPHVVGVSVASSNWTPEFLGALEAEGVGGEYGYLLRTGSEQLNVVPWTNLDTISVTFSEAINADDPPFSLAGVNRPIYGLNGFSYDPDTFTATWTFNGRIQADALTFTLDDTITDLSGNRLDGEWVDGVSSLSGDGIAGGAFEFDFNVLPGDTNRDGIVNFGGDLNSIIQTSGSSIGTPNYSIYNDINGDGLINFGGDLGPVIQHSGESVPARIDE